MDNDTCNALLPDNNLSEDLVNVYDNKSDRETTHKSTAYLFSIQA